VLALICWDVPLLLFCAFSGNVTAAVGLEKPAARIYLLSAALNLVLNLLFIPAFGKTAAAGVTVLTDAITATQFSLLLAGHMQLGQIRGYLARVVLAAALMGGAVWLALSFPLAVPILIGMLCYGALALAMRLVDPLLLVAVAQRARQRFRRS
jgi:O-antigen/teichoic acid export membrane protein